MILQIRKKSTSSWEHIKGGQNIILSKGSFRLQNENFELTEISGVDQFDQPTTPLADITLYDDTASGLPETFTNTTDFVDRLRELGYPFFSAASGGSGAVEQIVAGSNITLDPPDGLGIVQISSTGGGGGGVTSIIAGAGISIDQSTGDVTITNTGGGANLEKDVNQVAHGFVAGNVIRLSGGTYVLAQADAVANANAVSFVTEVVDVDNFKVQSESYISVNLGLIDGDEAFLSTTVAGGVQTTEPANGEVNVYLGQQTPQGFLISISTGFVVGSGGGGVPPTADTGTILDLSNYNGTYYNMDSADSNTTYTFTGEVLGGKAIKLVNCPTEPTVTNAIRISGNGVDFEPNADIYLICEYNGQRAEYYYKEITSLVLSPYYLRISNISQTSISLEWDYIGNIQSFSIERSVDNVSFSEVGTSVTSSYTDTVISDTKYYYRVRVFSGAKFSFYSNTTEVLTLNATSKAHIDRMTSPTVFSQSFSDELIKQLQNVGIYSELDMLQVFSSHNEASALLDYIRTATSGVVGGTLGFTAKEGFAQSNSGYVRTGFNPLNDSVNSSQDDMTVFVWILTDIQENQSVIEASSNAYAQRTLITINNLTNSYSVKLNDASFTGGTPATELKGLHSIQRTASNAFNYYVNGSLQTNSSSVSTGLPDADLYVLARALDDAPDDYSNQSVALVGVGSSNINQVNLYNAFFNAMYLTGVADSTDWQPPTTGNYGALSGVNQTSSIAWTPTQADDRAYNHISHIIEHDSQIHLMYATSNTEEEESGQWVRYQYSSDNGDTWSTPIDLIPPQDVVGGYADERRVCVPNKWVVINGKLYASVDIHERATGVLGLRSPLANLCVEVISNTPQIPFYITNVDGTTNPLVPKSGFPEYEFNELISTQIINHFLEPECRPEFLWSLPQSNVLNGEINLDGVSVTEPTTAKLPNGIWMRMWRTLIPNANKTIQFSKDGYYWGKSISSTIPDWSSRSNLKVLSNNVVVNIGNPPNTARSPLFIALSNDGITYSASNIYDIDTETTGPVYPGSFKDTGVQYPDTIELSNGQIMVAYSVNKEDIKVTRFDKPVLV